MRDELASLGLSQETSSGFDQHEERQFLVPGFQFPAFLLPLVN
jgi:hypothetical protein